MQEILLYFFIAASGLLLYARFFEPLAIEISSHKIHHSSAPDKPLTILHLTDLHFKGGGVFENLKRKIALQKIRSRVSAIDLLLVTGDLIESNRGIPAAVEFINQLPAPRLGIFACLGNHDYVDHDFMHALFSGTGQPPRRKWAENITKLLGQLVHNEPIHLDFPRTRIEDLVEALESAGVTVLINQNVIVKTQDLQLAILGVDDLSEGKPDVNRAAQEISEGGFTIVLAHNPDLLREHELHQFDLSFSGHVHGGQIRLPFWGPFYTQGCHMPRNKTSGWFEYGRLLAFVSRGYGEGTPLRFNCRPEITIIELGRQN